jgi:imidazolonepropionase
MIAALPTVAGHGLAVFADSFPERGFFSRDEAVRFSKNAKVLGLGIKVHADELSNLGVSQAFIDMGAASIDHLQHIDDGAVAALGASETTATLLPATSFYLGLPYADARRLIDAGAKVALATDFNPGTAPSQDLRFTAVLAASSLKMSAAEILCAVTYNSACSLGLLTEFGTLAASKRCPTVLFAEGNFSTMKPQALLEEIIANPAIVTVPIT